MHSTAKILRLISLAHQFTSQEAEKEKTPPTQTQYDMTDTTARKLAAAAAELYLITRQKPRNSPMRLLGPSDLRLMRLPGRKLRKRREKRLALPEYASVA